jgi:hypothetical protein
MAAKDRLRKQRRKIASAPIVVLDHTSSKHCWIRATENPSACSSASVASSSGKTRDRLAGSRLRPRYEFLIAAPPRKRGRDERGDIGEFSFALIPAHRCAHGGYFLQVAIVGVTVRVTAHLIREISCVHFHRNSLSVTVIDG